VIYHKSTDHAAPHSCLSAWQFHHSYSLSFDRTCSICLFHSKAVSRISETNSALGIWCILFFTLWRKCEAGNNFTILWVCP